MKIQEYNWESFYYYANIGLKKTYRKIQSLVTKKEKNPRMMMITMTFCQNTFS